MRKLRTAVFIAAAIVTPQTRSCHDAVVQAGEPRKPVSLDSPYAPRLHVFRGQTHAHTTRSDGRQSPTQVVSFYRKAGYDFVSLSDHRVITPDPGVPGILYLDGIEDNDVFANGAFDLHHENRTGATGLIPLPRPPQAVFDQASAEGSFSVINHPDWPGHYPKNPGWSDAELLAARGYDAIEVWNANLGYSSERRADMLLTAGRRLNLAVADDCHDIRNPSCGTTWFGVFADELTAPAVITGLRSGNYYSSRGARITAITDVGRTVTVKVPEESRIEFIVKGGVVAQSQSGVVESRYDARPDDLYIRVRVTQGRNRLEAWTNPIYIRTAA